MKSARIDGGFFAASSCRKSLLVCLPTSLFCWVALAFKAFAQDPVIDGFTPAAGTAGDSIQITGSGFSGSPVRLFFWNGVRATDVSIASDTIMTVTVPAGISTGPLGVSGSSGQVSFTPSNFLAISTGPYITDFSPDYGGHNDLVTINGVHFSSVAPNGVKFGGVNSSDAFPNGDGTLITVHVPAGAPVGSAPIAVTTTAGTSNSPSSFTVIGPGPYVTGFSPDHGSFSTPVLIDGVHFTGVTNVNFNGVAGVNLSVQSDTLISVTAPANVTSGPLTVNSPNGTWTTLNNFYVQPAVSGFNANSGRAGTNVTITGANFRGATAVLFNGTSAAFSVVNNTNIQTTVPAGSTTGLIRINTPNYSCFSGSNFVVRPTIYGFTPTFGPAGRSVTITGANFNVGTPVVRFNGIQAATPTGVSFGQLTAVVPSGATTGPISVSTTDGSHTNINKFYLPASITSFTPTNSPPGSVVTITGQNFTDASAVAFNGNPAVFTVSNNTTIGASVPADLITGPISVTTPAGSTTNASLFYGAPLISSFSPTTGLPGTNVTIIGTNFLGTRAVRFNGLAASFNSVSNGQLVAVAPIGVQTGPITVEGPAGTNTSTTNFVVNYPSDLEVWMTDSPDPVFVTSNLTYSVTMINHGPFNAPNVRLTNTLPSTVAYISADVPFPWSLTTNGQNVVVTTPTVAVGSTTTFNITVAPQAPGTIVNTASIASDQADPVPANNAYVITTYVLPLPVLSIRLWTNQVRVAWPSALTNFLVQTKTNLTDASWLVLSNSVPTVSGSIQYILDPTNAPSKHYRLKSQP